MDNTSGHIIKGDKVKVEGQFRLDTGSAATATAASPDTPKASPGSVKTQARIIENNPEFVLIELTCSCGTKTNIKCQYADANTANAQTNTDAGANAATDANADANANADADTQPPPDQT